jgi:predicted permease
LAALIDVILPVFLLLGFGYVAVWRGFLSEADVDGLMTFAQKFAIPFLLFRAFSTLDLGQSFGAALLFSFYFGMLASFAAGVAGARLLFGRAWEDAIAIGFCCAFSNTVLIGLSITERAYGGEALAGNYAIIALHSPVGFVIGITLMEIVRARDGGGVGGLIWRVGREMLHNPLVIGILAGFALNLSGLALPGPVGDAVDLVIRTALPIALVGLGGVLYQYRPEGDLRTVAFVIAVSLLLHPALTWGMGRALGLPVADLRSAVVTAASPPGVNTYLFAFMYGVAKRVSATAVLVGTGAALLSMWMWLAVLP